MKNPFISIIVPVYNIEKYLARCIESILAQTYTNLELILVDDGSTDQSGRICDTYAKKDNRVRTIHKTNGGSSSARNLGIREAKGEYLGFVDSDDYIEKNMYEELVYAIENTGCNIVQVARDEIDEEGNRLPDICEMPKEVTIYTAEEFLKELLLHKGDCSFCTKLLNRDLFNENIFPQGVLNEDFHLLVKMLEKRERVASLPVCGYHVFYRIGSNTRKRDRTEFSRVFGDCVDNADMVMEMAEEKFPNLVEVSIRFGLYQRMEYLLHIPICQMTKDNEQYKKICIFVRRHRKDIRKNPYLTKKNKCYLYLFSIAPRTIRQLHRMIKLNRLGEEYAV